MNDFYYFCKKKTMKSYNFRECSFEMLEQTFGIEQTGQSLTLSDWIKKAKKTTVSKDEQRMIEHFQSLLSRNLLGWNKQELALNFIGPILSLVLFSKKNTTFLPKDRLMLC